MHNIRIFYTETKKLAIDLFEARTHSDLEMVKKAIENEDFNRVINYFRHRITELDRPKTEIQKNIEWTDEEGITITIDVSKMQGDTI